MQRPSGFDRLSLKTQLYITHLENTVARQAERLDQQLGVADEKTPVMIYNFDITASRPIPEFACIRFMFGEFDQYVDVQKNRDTRGGLTVRAGRCLSITPEASNSILVKQVDMP